MNNYNIKDLREKLDRCKNMDLNDVSLDDVDEISSIKIDKRKPSNQRILDFLSKTKNPYIFKVNNKLVKIGFSDNNRTADDALTCVLKIYIGDFFIKKYLLYSSIRVVIL